MLASVVVGLVIVLSLSSCGFSDHPSDKRAYSDSNDGSKNMEEALGRFRIPAPPCETVNLRYSALNGGLSLPALYLKFGAGRECVQEFLRALIGDDSEVAGAMHRVEGAVVPLSRAGEDYGWKFEDETEYLGYRASIHDSVGVVGIDVFVDDRLSVWEVYLRAYIDE